MKLYFGAGACGLASQIVMREAGLKFDLVKVDTKTKESHEGDYFKINPKGYIPALKLDNGEMLTEGQVILQYISDQNPEKKLLPKYGTMERYRAMEWLNFVATEMHKMMGLLFNPAMNDDFRTAAQARIQQRLKILNTQLEKTPYILGNEFSAVDAYAYNILRWSNHLKVDLTPHKGILAFYEKVAARPSVRASIEGEGLRA